MPTWYLAGNERFRGPVFQAATVAGAGAWDDASKTANVTVSGGGLIVTASGTTASGNGTRTTTSHTTGKYYSEHTLTNHAGGGTNTGIAILDATFSVGSIFMGGDTHSYSLYTDNSLYTNGAPAANFFGLATSAVMQVALDAGNKLVWFNHNDLGWLGAGGTSGDPVAGTNGFSLATLSGALYLGVDFETSENGTIWTSSFGPTYALTKPSGYSDW